MRMAHAELTIKTIVWDMAKDIMPQVWTAGEGKEIFNKAVKTQVKNKRDYFVVVEYNWQFLNKN